MRKLTIFEHFSTLGFTKEQVLEAINILTDKQKEIIVYRHGGNLNNPTYTSALTQSQRSMYQYALRKVGTTLIQMYRTDNTDDIEIIISPPKNTLRKAKTRKSIYEKFMAIGYRRENIQEVLDSLDEQDKQIIILMNGSDLDNPVKSEKATKQDENHYYQGIMRKIEKRLKKKYGIVEKNTEPKKDIIEVKSTVIVDIPEKPEEVVLPSVEEEIIKENTVKPTEEFGKDDYCKLLTLIKTPTFGELMTKISPKAAVIISLRLGYVDDKYFSTESIATFLGIEPEEVRETTKEILNLYKDNLNNFIDQAIVSLNNKANTRKLTP